MSCTEGAKTDFVMPTYAEDTFYEVLGWYGLEGNQCPSESETSPTSEAPLDLTNSQPVLKVNRKKKHIGIRYLFPPLTKLTLYEVATIWVKRHDSKYFVGWSEAELEGVSELVRPIRPISLDQYKLHMNRSEFCRNVKLKFCLETDTEWAAEYRQRLGKTVAEGGFTGLSQAKLVASELWRKYSTQYKGHQARYPNPKSKTVARLTDIECKQEMDVNEESQMNGQKSECDMDGEKGDADSEVKVAECTDEENRELENLIREEGIVLKDDKPLDMNKKPENVRSLKRKKKQANLDETECKKATIEATIEIKQERCEDDFQQSTKNFTNDCVTDMQKVSTPDLPQTSSDAPLVPAHPSVLAAERSGSLSVDPLWLSVQTIPLKPEPDFATATSEDVKPPTTAVVLRGRVRGRGRGAARSRGAGCVRKKDAASASSSWKRGERGLSFLFPSLNDFSLSLADKVHVTVLRHKHNYFLDWPPDDLNKVSAIVRPRMPVTQQIYKEYCHRNAMKYDSNLQFAMESPEPWAEQFRAKLDKTPSDGGFSSLCEVKLEAGRLWKEFSGKYRMHNIVKYHMDRNSSVDTDTGGGGDVKPVTGSSPTADTHGGGPDTPGGGSSSLPSCSPLYIATDDDGGDSQSPVNLSLPAPSPAAGGEGEARAGDDQPQDLSMRSAGGETTADRAGSECSGGSQHDGADAASPCGRTSPGDGPPGGEGLFLPLPPSMPAYEQLGVWLERHRSDYFVGWSEAALAAVSPLVRPRCQVTPQVRQRCIPQSLHDVLHKVSSLMTSRDPRAVTFQERATCPQPASSPRGAGDDSFQAVLTEAVRLWHNINTTTAQRIPASNEIDQICNSEKDSTSPDDIQHQNGITRLSLWENGVEGHNGCQSTASDENDEEEKAVNLKMDVADNVIDSNIGKDDSDKTSAKSSGVCILQDLLLHNNNDTHPMTVKILNGFTEPRSKAKVPSWLQNGHTSPPAERGDKANGDSVSASGSPPPLQPVEAGSKSSDGDRISPPTKSGSEASVRAAATLFRLRPWLASLVAADPARSWVERLAPWRGLLCSALGPEYSPPATPEACMVDVMLAALASSYRGDGGAETGAN